VECGMEKYHKHIYTLCILNTVCKLTITNMATMRTFDDICDKFNVGIIGTYVITNKSFAKIKCNLIRLFTIYVPRQQL
jgi:hypothetical protein